MDHHTLRALIVATCRAMNARGLNRGTSGNIAARIAPDRFLITPSGTAYETMRPTDIVAMSTDGRAEGRLRPSGEWRLHARIFEARPEVSVVIHAHATFCTVLAVHGLAIPAFHYMVAVAGGHDIRCAPYHTPTGDALARAVPPALEGRRACLLAHHGVVVIGTELAATLDLLEEVEALAEHYWRARLLGEPPLLGGAQMDEVLALMASYGSRAPEAPPAKGESAS